jgi:hypothetical protein
MLLSCASKSARSIAMTLTQAFVLTPLVDVRVRQIENKHRTRRVRDHRLRAYKMRKAALTSSIPE